MSQVSPNMALAEWNLVSDNFSHSTLQNNFTLIDQHDHSTGKGVQVGTAGIANQAVGSQQLALNAVGTSQIATGAVTSATIAANAVSIAKLGSDVTTDYGYAFSAYRHISTVGGATRLTTTSIYLMDHAGYFNVSAGAATNPNGAVAAVFYLDSADYAAGTRTVKGNLRTYLATNTVSPGAITFSYGLYPVTVTAGGSNADNTYTAGTVVTGSTVVYASPGASFQSSITSTSANPPTSGDFALTAGLYAVGITVSSAMAANSIADMRATLRIRQQ